MFSSSTTRRAGNVGSVQPDSLVLTRQQAATYLGVSPSSLATWASRQTHAIPYVKIGRSVRYRKSDLDAFLQSNTHGIDPLVGAQGSSVFSYAQSKGVA